MRLTRPWSCHVCHRYFEEAVNPAEDLPTDQNYYEKFDHRYCTMACLSAHRKAGLKGGSKVAGVTRYGNVWKATIRDE